MINLHVLSDLHLDFTTIKHHAAPDGTDVVILAGDTHPGVAGIIWAAQTFPGLPVLYLAGNHEFYGKRALDRHPERMRSKARELNGSLGSDVRFCDRDVHVVKGVRFACATLWTDYALHGDQQEGMIQACGGFGGTGGMNDYRRICRTTNRLVRPADLLAEHVASRSFIQEVLDEPFSGSTVVVTHHAPAAASLAPDLRDDALSPCYASRLEGLMEGLQAPELWIHGHIHRPQDYECGRTRVLANPRGYVERGYTENPEFDPACTVAVGDRPVPMLGP